MWPIQGCFRAHIGLVPEIKGWVKDQDEEGKGPGAQEDPGTRGPRDRGPRDQGTEGSGEP